MRKKYFEYLIDDSDVDLYIERGGLKSLIQYFAFIDELENVFDFRVVTTGIEEKTFFFRIMQEGVLLSIRVTCVLYSLESLPIDYRMKPKKTAQTFHLYC